MSKQNEPQSSNEAENGEDEAENGEDEAESAFGVLAEKQRADQLSVNCQWLIDKIDRIHQALCPRQFGTWQQRAEQAVEAAERRSGDDK
jgi:hypothetical protein